MITRLTKLKGFDNLLAGRDLANVFEEGCVYDVIKIADTIIVKKRGEHALKNNYSYDRFSDIMMEGSYCLTKEEYERRKQ